MFVAAHGAPGDRLVLMDMPRPSSIIGFGESGRAVLVRSGSALTSVLGVGSGADPFHVAWKKLAAALFISPASIIAAGATCAGLVEPPERELGEPRPTSGLLARGALADTALLDIPIGDGGFGGADFDSRRVRIDRTSSLGDPAVGDLPAGSDICRLVPWSGKQSTDTSLKSWSRGTSVLRKISESSSVLECSGQVGGR